MWSRLLGIPHLFHQNTIALLVVLNSGHEVMNQHDTTAIWYFQPVVLRAVWYLVRLKAISLVCDFDSYSRR